MVMVLFRIKSNIQLVLLHRLVVLDDFNNDGHLDIVVTNDDSADVSVLLGYGNGTFQNQSRYSFGPSQNSIVVGDFNNDTRLDIVVASYDAHEVTIIFGSMDVIFVKQQMLACDNDSRARSFVIRDFNNDSYSDIVVANSGTHNIGVFLGYGNMSFSNATIYSTGTYSSPYSIGAGDFNGDTYLDIVVANSNSSNIAILFGCGNGSFVNQTTYLTDSYPYSVDVGDFNNDTILDIIVANYGSNTVRVFRGYQNGTFAIMEPVQLEYGSHSFSVVVGDFNNDEKLDFVVANNGTDSLQVYLQTC